MRVLLNDPPRERIEGPDGFVPLPDLIGQSDIVTFHVPLTKHGPDATAGMAGKAFFEKLKRGCLFINAARGPVTDTDALLDAMASGKVAHAVIDTWNPEPAFRTDLLAKADIGTPHIAGHSFEGKVMGTLMIYRSVCRFLGIEPSWTPDALMPAPVVPAIAVDAAGRSDQAILWDVVRRVYDVGDDDRRLRECKTDDAEQRARCFEQLRREYPVRREFRFTSVAVKNGGESVRETLSGLGFRLSR